MKDILVLTHRSEDFLHISDIIKADYTVSLAVDFEKAKSLHTQSPFDMIIADINLLEQQSGEKTFKTLVHPFVQVNSFVKCVALCSKNERQKGILAEKEGAFSYLLYPVCQKQVQLLLTSAGRTLSREFELDYLRDYFWKTEWLEIIQSKNARMKKIYESIRSVAPTIATVLLSGDTGTGKGLLARLIHWHSQRSNKPFIEIHCGAIPENLVESELFGHEKGSFTGADRKKHGKFEIARGGTIFLDEIGTIRPSVQIKLLQVLQDGIYSRVGGESMLKSDVRIIAATNADLEQKMKNGEFRKDLFYRLNIFPIAIPPLSERMEDLSHLATLFLKKLCIKYRKEVRNIHPSVLDGFKKYDWPGNIRELENIIERAYILEDSSQIMPRHFPVEIIPGLNFETPENVPAASLAQARQQAINTFEQSYLTALLEKAKGRINRAAFQAKITPRQLNRLLSRHGLDKNDFKLKKEI